MKEDEQDTQLSQGTKNNTRSRVVSPGSVTRLPESGVRTVS